MAISIDIVIPHYKDIEALESMMGAMTWLNRYDPPS
jgi:hypothetical protein